MNVKLPEELEAFVEGQARRGGYLSPEEFVIDLIRREEAEAETRDRTGVELLLSTLTDIEWGILKARFDAGDASLTPDEREALFIYEVRLELAQETAPELQTYDPPRFPPKPKVA